MVRFIFFGRVLSKHKQAQMKNKKVNLEHRQGYKGTTGWTDTVSESPWPQAHTTLTLSIPTFLTVKNEKKGFVLTLSGSSPETEKGFPLGRKNRKRILTRIKKGIGISKKNRTKVFAFKIRLPSYRTEEAPLTPTSVTNIMFNENQLQLFFSVPYLYNKISRSCCYAYPVDFTFFLLVVRAWITGSAY